MFCVYKHGLAALLTYQYVIITQASLICFCNSNKCLQKNSTTCVANFACYAELYNTTLPRYGCVQQPGKLKICSRQSLQQLKPYLRACCFKNLCNEGRRWKYFNTHDYFRVVRTRRKPNMGIRIPQSLDALGSLSPKALSVIAAGGLFILILILACAVYILWYDERAKIVEREVTCKSSTTDV